MAELNEGGRSPKGVKHAGKKVYSRKRPSKYRKRKLWKSCELKASIKPADLHLRRVISAEEIKSIRLLKVLLSGSVEDYAKQDNAMQKIIISGEYEARKTF
ncbi:hypothetical protein KQX54_019825 [Cotesia glomerata]|uniref:Uncharacterized protein n=1 Tax=Cotesia glomerata TaxID=32391 RepID=A0AAV7J0F6_COTGL|nr:hypothetical protein KQX54_019825 [Cotesia glomerata]